ncbi:MAG: TRAP transporter small permease [Hyphomicrobiales bacterium]|nr:TRAP transporter small permease [Hyphomicrobiales bacterium]
MIEKLLHLVSRGLLVVSASLALLISFIVVADVLGRVGFNHPLKGTPEIVSSSIVVICYLQSAYAVLSGGMIEVDAFSQHFPPKVKAAVGIFGCMLGVFLFGIILTGSWTWFIHSVESGEFQGEGALHVPMWPVRLAVVIGSFLSAASYILLAFKQIEAARRDEIFATGVSHQ